MAFASKIFLRFLSWAFALWWFAVTEATGAGWLRPEAGTNQLVWGLPAGLHFAIFPAGFTGGDGGPRGLIRIGYPTLTNGQYDLINFIAIEPVVGEVRGYSELEQSHSDGQRGKLFVSGPIAFTNVTTGKPSSGRLPSPQDGVVEMTLPLRIEKFDNGAHIRLGLSQRSDAPDELRITVYSEPDSARLKSCILTATMGNKSRTRQLWLKDGPVSSLKLFDGYTGAGFAPQVFFPLSRVPRNVAGDGLIAISNDEENPAAALAADNFWKYRGGKVTQYWRKPVAGLNDTLRCAVNARFTYWMSNHPIPGGLAFENFELVDVFKEGQEFIFGVTKRAPAELLQ
jgi:hypothetical protein